MATVRQKRRVNKKEKSWDVTLTPFGSLFIFYISLFIRSREISFVVQRQRGNIMAPSN